MNEWMETFIAQCMADVPWGKYRQRTEKELRDHMETQYQVLTERGTPPSEARGKILEAMGDPERLRKEYLAAWQRSPEKKQFVQDGIVEGCVLMGALYVLTFGLLGVVGFTYDAVIPGCVCFPILSGNKIYVTVFSTVLFLLPFTLGALFLRFFFRKESRPVGLVTAGLLAAWAGEKASIILISLLIYGPPLDLALLVRIYDGGDTTAPWLSPTYCLLTFVGCLMLGQLFGRKNERRHELA